jgi:two-component system, chemotaxis family, protein-glutamate methylesterase/glutaminase
VTVRTRLRDVLAADPGLDVVGEAADGATAVELCQRIRPDVLTMDLMLPVLSGLGAIEQIMAHCATPVLVVSSADNRGELYETYEALAAGAVDSLDKPCRDEPIESWERRLIAAVKLVSRIRVISHPRAKLGGAIGSTTVVPPPPVPAIARRFAVAALGTSTGGPGALVSVLRALPARYPIPLLVVLHIGEPFALGFPEWLSGQTQQAVRYAEDGEDLAALAGRVVMAPPGRHLTVRAGRLMLTSEPERHSCRPSVDVLFESLARECGPSAAAGLLTGMGRDGARGLLALRAAGGFTIAQDEATSAVYGMPREAAQLGAAERILPLDQIGAELARLPDAHRAAGRRG